MNERPLKKMAIKTPTMIHQQIKVRKRKTNTILRVQNQQILAQTSTNHSFEPKSINQSEHLRRLDLLLRHRKHYEMKKKVK